MIAFVSTVRRLAQRLPFLVLLALALPSGNGDAASRDASESIRLLYDSLLSTMRDGPSLGPQGRYERLKPVIRQTFDISYMAHEVVGPVWARVSPAQQEQLADALARYITATYADRFNSYSGQELRVTGEKPRAANVIVESEIVKPDGTPVSLKYLMRKNGEDWQIADIYLDGTISEMAARRSEFSTIVQRQG